MKTRTRNNRWRCIIDPQRLLHPVERRNSDCHVVWSACRHVTSDTNRRGQNFLVGKETSRDGKVSGKLPERHERQS